MRWTCRRWGKKKKRGRGERNCRRNRQVAHLAHGHQGEGNRSQRRNQGSGAKSKKKKTGGGQGQNSGEGAGVHASVLEGPNWFRVKGGPDSVEDQELPITV